jgi:hypothetical protein
VVIVLLNGEYMNKCIPIHIFSLSFHILLFIIFVHNSLSASEVWLHPLTGEAFQGPQGPWTIEAAEQLKLDPATFDAEKIKTYGVWESGPTELRGLPKGTPEEQSAVVNRLMYLRYAEGMQERQSVAYALMDDEARYERSHSVYAANPAGIMERQQAYYAERPGLRSEIQARNHANRGFAQHAMYKIEKKLSKAMADGKDIPQYMYDLYEIYDLRLAHGDGLKVHNRNMKALAKIYQRKSAATDEELEALIAQTIDNVRITNATRDTLSLRVRTYHGLQTPNLGKVKTYLKKYPAGIDVYTELDRVSTTGEITVYTEDISNVEQTLVEEMVALPGLNEVEIEVFPADAPRDARDAIEVYPMGDDINLDQLIIADPVLDDETIRQLNEPEILVGEEPKIADSVIIDFPISEEQKMPDTIMIVGKAVDAQQREHDIYKDSDGNLRLYALGSDQQASETSLFQDENHMMIELPASSFFGDNTFVQLGDSGSALSTTLKLGALGLTTIILYEGISAVTSPASLFLYLYQENEIDSDQSIDLDS